MDSNLFEEWVNKKSQKEDRKIALLVDIYPAPSIFNPLRTNPTKWPNTLKQFVAKNCLSV